MKTLMQYWTTALLALVLGVTAAGFTACETVEGAGRDVQQVGEATEDTADEARPY